MILDKIIPFEYTSTIERRGSDNSYCATITLFGWSLVIVCRQMFKPQYSASPILIAAVKTITSMLIIIQSLVCKLVFAENIAEILYTRCFLHIFTNILCGIHMRRFQINILCLSLCFNIPTQCKHYFTEKYHSPMGLFK